MNENRSVKTDFDRALAENGIALEKFGALTEQEREKLAVARDKLAKLNARIEDLAHGVDLLHVLLDHTLRLGHMPRKPLDIQFFKILRHIISQLRYS